MQNSSTILLVLLFAACGESSVKKTKSKKPATTTEQSKPVTIKLLPLGKTTSAFIQNTFSQLKQIVKNIELLPHEEMPAAAWYAPRLRHRADTLIAWMSRRAKDNEVYLGITRQDISTTKGDNPDSGIMGLGYQPGNACIASDFRLRDKTNFFKVVIHELGHTTGLPHCPEKTCFMRDAEGGDPTGEEKEFCIKCKAHLTIKGWKL